MPRFGPIRDDVDRVEVNHVYNGDGEKILTQAIFWEFRNGVWIVRDWKMLTSDRQHPRRDVRKGVFRMMWDDGGTMRDVRAKIRIETHTQYDPELKQRAIHPVEFRRRLTQTKGLRDYGPGLYP